MLKNTHLSNNYKGNSRKIINKIYFLVCLFVMVSIIVTTVSGCSKKSDNDEKAISISNEDSTQKNKDKIQKPAKNKSEKDSPSSGNNDGKTVVADSYFNDAVFIGDSRTEGFMMYTGLKNATFYTHKGLMVNTAFTAPVINVGGKRISVMSAIEKNKNYKKVYIMLGINELGWAYSNLFIEKYGLIIDAIKKSSSDVKIIIQSLIPVTKSKSKSDKIYNNEKIREYNLLLKKLATDKKVYYVNVAEAFEDDNGCLPEDAAFDGVHLKKPYCEKWLEYLKSHTV